MDQATVAPRLRPSASLGRRMALLILPLVLVPVALIGGTGYLRSRQALANQATAQLQAVASSQVSQLLEWAELRVQRLQLGSQGADLREPLGHLLHDNLSQSERAELQTAIAAEFEDIRATEGEVWFSQVVALDPTNGEIVAATNPDWVGQSLMGDLLEDIAMDQVVSRPEFGDELFSPGAISFITSIPMRTGMMTEIDAVLIGVNQELRVGALIEELQVFSQQRGVYLERTGDTFLLMEPDLLLQQQYAFAEPVITAGSNHPVFDLRNEDTLGSSEYTGLSGETVLGAYEWIPDMGLGVVIEVPSETIFAELTALFPFIITLIAATSLLTLLVAVFATSRMLRPLGRLAEFATRFSRGEWDYRVPATRQDEIGVVSQALNRMAEELQDSYATLEQRVQDRTQQIRTASEVARAVTSIPALEDLLRQAVELIGERFGYYYVSIFLLDEDNSHAVLRQGTGEVGEALVARNHQLAVGSESIIGWVTANNQPRVASDVSQDPVHFRNELLPETRSEAAVPLQVGGGVLGALDVQSVKPDAFTDEDIEVLQTLADQLSAAIQNARLAETSVAAAERARLISDVTSRMSGMLDVDQVLNTAANSLHQALGQSEIMIRLTAPGSDDGGEFGG